MELLLPRSSAMRHERTAAQNGYAFKHNAAEAWPPYLDSLIFHNVLAYGMLEVDKPLDAWPANFDSLVRNLSLLFCFKLPRC